MDPVVMTSLISAEISVFMLVWNVATVKVVRSLALSAEEAAKRNELVRMHALKIIDEVFGATASIITEIGTLIFLEKHGSTLDANHPDVQRHLAIIGIQRANVYRLWITSAPYLSDELRSIPC